MIMLGYTNERQKYLRIPELTPFNTMTREAMQYSNKADSGFRKYRRRMLQRTKEVIHAYLPPLIKACVESKNLSC